ncbi:hypothetical protein H0H93_013118 [Arthromyces matolae]|nr:hypothetical protein H0H93_013118 [Arthromyces matolae]
MIIFGPSESQSANFLHDTVRVALLAERDVIVVALALPVWCEDSVGDVDTLPFRSAVVNRPFLQLALRKGAVEVSQNQLPSSHRALECFSPKAVYLDRLLQILEFTAVPVIRCPILPHPLAYGDRQQVVLCQCPVDRERELGASGVLVVVLKD